MAKKSKAVKRKPTTGSAAPYVATPKEQAAAQHLLDRRNARPPAARLEVLKENGELVIRPDHPDNSIGSILITNAFGATNADFTGSLTGQLLNIAGTGQNVSTNQLNSVVAMVQGIGPKDETEAMLAAQMVAIHNATMSAARSLKNCENIPQQDSAANMLTKLARTFTMQIEALKGYRSTGEQNIRVQHVTVNDGGQAIVGNVQTRGGAKNENHGQPLEPCRTDERGTAMFGHVEAITEAVSGTGNEGLDRVPVPRRARRSAERQSQR
jgi:hypothetical protein